LGEYFVPIPHEGIHGPEDIHGDLVKEG
jgi:hypothetical protein